MKRVLLIALGLSVGGCATVTRGTTNNVTFETVPEGASVSTDKGHACASTPCIMEVSRKTEFVATFSKEGYEDQSVPVRTQVAGAGAAGFAGNLLVGGIVGMGVDAATGSTLEHYPNPVRAELIPLASSKPHKRKRQRPAKLEAPTS